MNFIFGSADYAWEIDWIVHDIYENTGKDFRPDYFVCEDEVIV